MMRGVQSPETMDQLLQLAAKGHPGAVSYLKQEIGFTDDQIRVAAQSAVEMSSKATEILEAKLKKTKLLTPDLARDLAANGVPLEESVMGFLASQQATSVFTFGKKSKSQEPPSSATAGLMRGYFDAQFAQHGIKPSEVGTPEIRGEGWNVLAQALGTTPGAMQEDETLRTAIRGASGENGIFSKAEARELLGSFPFRGKGWAFLALALKTTPSELYARVQADPALSEKMKHAAEANGGPGQLSEKEAKKILLDQELRARLSQPAAEAKAISDPPKKSTKKLEYGSMRADVEAALATPPGVRGILLERQNKALEGYYVGYAAAFPDPDERESTNALKGYLRDPEMPTYDITTIQRGGKVIGGLHKEDVEATTDLRALMGDVLARAKKSKSNDSEAIGAALDKALAAKKGKLEGEETAATAVGIQYVWVDEENRYTGAGTAAIERLEKEVSKAKGWGTFAEVNDPQRMSEEQRKADAIDPRIRRAFYEKLGYKAVDARYIQLPIEEGGAPVDYLGFLVKPTDKEAKTIPSDLYLSFVTTYFTGFPKFASDTMEETLQKIFADPSYREIVASIGDRKELPLLPSLSEEDRKKLPPR
jgi:hypothetical protein